MRHSVLSNLTQYTAVVLSPKGMQPRLRTIQLVPVSSERHWWLS